MPAVGRISISKKGEAMKEKFASLSRTTRFVILVAGGIAIVCCLCLAVVVIIPSNKTSPQVSTVTDSRISQPTNTFLSSETNRPEPSPTDSSPTIMLPSSTPTEIKPSATPTANPFSKLIVPTGQLAQYRDTYSDYDEVFVTKLDGSLDARPNDLEELCLDWLYYRDKILEYTQSGKTEKADDARAAWNDINNWLDEYDENDIQTMFSIIEDDAN
jgi:hypothetical protein